MLKRMDKGITQSLHLFVERMIKLTSPHTKTLLLMATMTHQGEVEEGVVFSEKAIKGYTSKLTSFKILSLIALVTYPRGAW
jgi:Na+/alanine symporter